MCGNIKALVVLLISILPRLNSHAQGFGTWNDLPFMVGNATGTNVLTSMEVLYDSFQSVTVDGNNRVTSWTNVAQNADHRMDLVQITNFNYTIATPTTNPIYSATAFNGHPGLIFWDGTHNASLFTSNYCVKVSQPFTTMCCLTLTNITGSPPFHHAIWSSNGDYDVGDQGFEWTGIWLLNSYMDTAGNQMPGGSWPTTQTVPVIITTVWNGASSFVRTNGVTYASGNIGVAQFGADSKGAGFAGFDFGATGGLTPIGILGRWALWSYELSTNDMQTVETQWRSDFGF